MVEMATLDRQVNSTLKLVTKLGFLNEHLSETQEQKLLL